VRSAAGPEKAAAGGSWHRGDLKYDGVGRLMGLARWSTRCSRWFRTAPIPPVRSAAGPEKAAAGGSWHRGDLKNDGVGRLMGMGTDSTEERERK
jgi:hypothetical protein